MKFFSSSISLVNVTKSVVSNGFDQIYLKKSLMENFVFCALALC